MVEVGYMASETITISKVEYKRLKKKEEVDTELLEGIAKSLADIKAGRVKPWK